MRNDYILKLLEKDERLDGRKLDEMRKVKIETGVVRRAEGSARVAFGKTDVIVGVKIEMETPFPDMPNMGVLKTGAEFSPIADADFEPGPPRENATELARVVDRGIRESECIDLEKLCIKEKEKVLGVYVDIHIINNDGNLIDASALAAVAALLSTNLPKVKDDAIVRNDFVGNLPVLHKPITVTVRKMVGKFILDPVKEEEELLDAMLTVAVREDGKICAMQKSGNKGLSEKDIDEMISIAVKKSKELRKFL